MKAADKIYNKIEAKRGSVEKAKLFISLNPLEEINKELRVTIIRMKSEIVVLENELNALYEKSI